MKETWLIGGTVLTMDAAGTVIEDGAIGIREGKIVYVGPRSGARPPEGAKVVDAVRCLVMPGLVNGHTHTGMTLLRGIADDLPLEPWLKTVIFPIEEKWGKPEFVHLGTLLASLEMIRSGTTLFNDMYYHEDFAARASHEAGLRMVAGKTVIEINAVEDKGPILEGFDEFRDQVRPYPLVVPAVAPHSVYGLQRDTWARILEYTARHDLLVHTHVAETREEVEECRQQNGGKTPVEVFDELGLWRQRAIAAHVVCVGEKDIQTLGRHGVGIAHNPESNLKLGSEISPVVELRRAGCRLVLGTDSTASNNNLDLLSEADTAAKLQVLRLGAGQLVARDVVRMLTIEGAAALGLDKVTGSLEVGKAGDVIAVDTDVPHATPLYDPYSHLVYSANGADVKHTVVNGRVLMENRVIRSLDEAAILAECREWGMRIAADLA